MRIYHYDRITNEYVGSEEADESPLEHGVFLIPAYATSTEPLEYDKTTQQLTFDNGSWNITQLPTVSPISLDELKNNKKKDLRILLYRLECTGILIHDTYIKTTLIDQCRMNSAILALTNKMIDSIEFEGVDGWILLTADNINLVGQLFYTQIQNLSNLEKKHLDNINGFNNVEDLELYNINIG